MRHSRGTAEHTQQRRCVILVHDPSVNWVTPVSAGAERTQRHKALVVRPCQPADAPRATSPITAATSFGRDHMGQWLVGRSTYVTSRSSASPPIQA